MVVLSDTTIHGMLDSGKLEIEPLDRTEQVQPASIDLRIAEDIEPLSQCEAPDSPDGKISFDPWNSYLASTQEYIDLPRDVCAFVKGRSSIGRLAIQVHTAGFGDPGWHGELTLEIVNFSDKRYTFEAGDRFCQIVLMPLDRDPYESYDEKPDSKYNGQTGPTESRFEGNYE